MADDDVKGREKGRKGSKIKRVSSLQVKEKKNILLEGWKKT